ncbi:metal-dependent hydrolase [Haloarchaeobius sp. TZWSO28]|uniref:metal-dependent hydrolase n=1 Tax=Haloarchaeobius sp. TZWSO28 TaxID=3446119 RepID=UPI003EB6D74F
MMVGHALLAFALVALLGRAVGVDRERALLAGAVAGAFAAVPDADMVYAIVGVAHADFTGVFAVTNAFWSASTVVHRAMTHSLVVAPFAAVGFALWTVRGRWVHHARLVGTFLLGTLILVATVKHGLLGFVVMGAFALMGVGVALAVWWRTALRARETFALALFGLASHPWGDLFTGEPPAMLWPLDTVLFAEIVTLAPDPTLHLLGAFALELLTVWLAVWVVLDASDEFRPTFDVRALAGVAYGGVAFLIPPPTLDVSYHFVFSILAVGTVAAAPDVFRARLLRSLRRLQREWDAARLFSAFLTGLAAVTLALAAYAVLYSLATLGSLGVSLG